MKYIDRIVGVVRSRGLGGLLRFLATRLGHRRADLLFERDLRAPGDPPRLPEAIRLVLIDRNNLGQAAVAGVERQIFVGDNTTYQPGVAGEDLLLAAIDEAGRVAAYAFVLFDTSYKRVLREPREVPMISNCFTMPEQRGRGLYVALLQAAAGELSRRGHARLIISCAPENTASWRGIERAGFRRVRRFDTVVLLARLIVWQRASVPMEQSS